MADIQGALNSSQGLDIGIKIANAVTMVVLIFVVLFGKKIMTLNLPYIDVAPWSCSS